MGTYSGGVRVLRGSWQELRLREEMAAGGSIERVLVAPSPPPRIVIAQASPQAAHGTPRSIRPAAPSSSSSSRLVSVGTTQSSAEKQQQLLRESIRQSVSQLPQFIWQ